MFVFFVLMMIMIVEILFLYYNGYVVYYYYYYNLLQYFVIGNDCDVIIICVVNEYLGVGFEIFYLLFLFYFFFQ